MRAMAFGDEGKYIMSRHLPQPWDGGDGRDPKKIESTVNGISTIAMAIEPYHISAIEYEL